MLVFCLILKLVNDQPKRSCCQVQKLLWDSNFLLNLSRNVGTGEYNLNEEEQQSVFHTKNPTKTRNNRSSPAQVCHHFPLGTWSRIMLPCRSGDSAGLSLHWFCRSLSLLPNYESFIYQCMKLVLWSDKLYRTHPSSTLSYNCILQASCIHTRAVFPSLGLWTLLKAECICVVVYKD